MLTLDLPPGVDEARARLILAVGLFQEEEVSVGKAAEIAGLSYREFLDSLVERRIPPFPADDDPVTIAAEMASIRRLVREVEAGK